MDFEYISDTGILHDGRMTMPDFLYLLEESGFCARCCWQEGRAMTIPVTALVERFNAVKFGIFQRNLSNLRGLVLFCIEADFCNQILIF